jgi:hypothetical protein
MIREPVRIDRHDGETALAATAPDCCFDGCLERLAMEFAGEPMSASLRRLVSALQAAIPQR